MFLKGQGRRWPLFLALIVFLCTLIYFHKQLVALPLPRIQSPLGTTSTIGNPSNVDTPLNEDGTKTHTEVYSVSTKDRKYFHVQFGGHKTAANTNIIPHPYWNDTFIIVAQKPPSKIPHTVWFAELVCNAQFNPKNGILECIEPPAILPIAATAGDRCKGGKIDYFNNLVGPHDARVFYGPKNPYVIYGSNGIQTACLAQWMEDFRLLVDWGVEAYEETKFRVGTELHRPEGKYMDMEKNFFAFWDKDGNMYTHYDIHPKRVFAKVEYDGTVGPDLAPLAEPLDSKCMAARMPKLENTKQENLHQATNSLSITMCKRADPNCKAEESNTFVFILFQYKSYFEYHGQYEPYVMIFSQQPPFQILGISNKPIWIYGRGGPGTGKKLKDMGEKAEARWKQTEMLYVTSMSWKERGRKYHGFLDDVLFIGFGIEDEVAGGIDIVAGDLFADMGSCLGT
ncbi:hypothetical protein DL95DRAFT_379991 [Leptodontidium sp. 2 PMI_412]|nr:hypothetical protein BKA61DRAFT_589080 [Leptodontidium sp. MPI-SDFR-AT-0119]KAH9223053.1 hypothetical protein DL95DRAFT_379991 [Leptodontidium sp. 2 PMI_412]